MKYSPYQTLFVVYSLVILSGTWEFFSRPAKPAPEPDIYGSPAPNLPETISKLYPNRPESEFLLGRRFETLAGRGYRQDEIQRNPELLQKFVDDLDAKLCEAAQHYERAIKLGFNSEENLHYNYALTLIRIQADPGEIDRAIAVWRKNFPLSDRRDLQQRRQSIEQQLRQLPTPSRFATKTADSLQHIDQKKNDLNLSDRSIAKLHETDVAGRHEPLTWQSQPGFVGSQACRECHVKQFESYNQTAHSRALTEVVPDNEPSDNEFNHAVSGRRYRVSRNENQLILEESLPLNDGTEFPLTSAVARYRVGSGHFARTYLCDAGDGFLVESPISWYESTNGWDMTPGFDKLAHASFSRQILENCLWCHAGRVELSTISNMRFRLIENAIGCERCHGPGEAHVNRQATLRSSTTEPDDSIVNPRRLSRKLAEAVCQQCHLQGDIHIGGHHVRAADYRPGRALEDFATIYRLRKRDTDMTVVGHVEQFHASKCYQQSETLTCVTCHNPHETIATNERTEHFRSICMTCHSDPGCRLPIAVREEQSKNDCLQCHMPKSPTEVTHVAFTHHRIGIHPLKDEAIIADSSDLLIPLSELSELSDLSESEKERSLMLARLQMFLIRGPEFHRSDAGRQLSEQIQRWFQSMPFEEIDAETEFARSQFLFAIGDQIQGERSAVQAMKNPQLRTEEMAVLLEQLGNKELGMNQFMQARLKFEKLTHLRSHGRDWLQLGICEERSGRLEPAIHAFERARQLEPGNLGIYDVLAAAYHSQANFGAEQRVRTDVGRIKRNVKPNIAPKSPSR